MVPFDEQSPFVTSGIRIGTAAITSRGMKEDDCQRIADWINAILMNREDDNFIAGIREEVTAFASAFPLYPVVEQGTIA